MAEKPPEERKAEQEAAAKTEGKDAEAANPDTSEKKQPAAVAGPAKKKPGAAKSRRKPPPAPTESNPTRREVLNYGWFGFIGLLGLQTVAASLWFAFPKFKAGQFGGEFTIGKASDMLPEVNAGPKPFADGKFWLVNIDTEINGELQKGVMAIYKVCTHLGCLYDWVPMTDRFECPCHGSKFELDGDYIAGPARRSLDRFVIKAVSPDGSVKETDAEGNPLEIEGDETLIVDTGQRILGSSDIETA